MTENSKKDEDANDVTNIFGKSGPWQLTIFAIACIISIFSAWNNLVMAFFAPNIDYWCKAQQNITGNGSWSTSKDTQQCEIESLNGSKEHCKEWGYNHDFYHSTIIEQWDLVCENDWLISMSQSVYMAGYMTSMLVFGQLSDRFGRRPVFFTSLAILLSASTACLFSTSFTMFTVLRFFISLGVSGAGATSFVLLMETVGPEYRSAYGLAYNFGWAFGYIVLPGIAWLLRNWFYLQLVITVPCATLILSWWFIPESPRWLLTNRHFEQAEDCIMKAAKKNKRNMDNAEGSFKQMKCTLEKNDEQQKQKQATILDLFKTPNIRKRTLNLFFCWFVNSFIYFGLSLNTNDLGGDPFLNFFIAGAIEFPAYIAAIYIIRIFGRRIPQMGTMVIGGMACVLTIPIGDNLLWLKITLAMIGKFCITASFGMVYVFSAEIFPTVVRNAGIGSSSTCARIGSMVAPFVKELGKATHPEVPFAVYGGLSVVSGLLILLLPETRKCQLPDTIEEGEWFGKKAYNYIEGSASTGITLVGATSLEHPKNEGNNVQPR